MTANALRVRAGIDLSRAMPDAGSYIQSLR
jgi:hypothetical protein